MTTITSVAFDQAVLARLRFAKWYAEKVGGDTIGTDQTISQARLELSVWPTRAYVRQTDGTLKESVNLDGISDPKAVRAGMDAVVAEYAARGYHIVDHRSWPYRPTTSLSGGE